MGGVRVEGGNGKEGTRRESRGLGGERWVWEGGGKCGEVSVVEGVSRRGGSSFSTSRPSRRPVISPLPPLPFLPLPFPSSPSSPSSPSPSLPLLSFPPSSPLPLLSLPPLTGASSNIVQCTLPPKQLCMGLSGTKVQHSVVVTPSSSADFTCISLSLPPFLSPPFLSPFLFPSFLSPFLSLSLPPLSLPFLFFLSSPRF